jgi:hypothetical protein
MTERDSSSGGLTGATGDLTPDAIPDELVTGERREIEDPERQAAVTQAQAHAAPAQEGDTGVPGAVADDQGPTELGTRDAGYGSEHGLSPTDPAYRMERRPTTVSDSPTPQTEPRIGGDDASDEEERF